MGRKYFHVGCIICLNDGCICGTIHRCLTSLIVHGGPGTRSPMGIFYSGTGERTMKKHEITKRFGQSADSTIEKFSINLPETVKEALEAYGEQRVLHTINEALKIDARSVYVAGRSGKLQKSAKIMADELATWKPSQNVGNRGLSATEKLVKQASKMTKAEREAVIALLQG